ncbi:MAG TPA: hypothetical protein VKO63_02875 [Chitinispirillaceae bacterium]|nr:hypothetical protein [Chitinispirillaceae bacterium]
MLSILRDLQKADILKHFVLVGSWCQEFYRYIYSNPIEIPATRTMDADILIPKQFPKDKKVSTAKAMLSFFSRKDQHIKRLHEIYNGLTKIGVPLPID